MKKHYLLLISMFFLISVTIKSQKLDQLLNVKYRTGIAILNNGDTLRGDFEFNDCEQNYHLLVFIDPVTLKKRAFDPREVKMFSIDSLTFFPKEIKGEKVFMRILINDILKVYLNKHFFTNDINSGSTNEFLCLKPTGESILVSMDSFYPFKTRVGDFFRDDNDLYLKIKKNRYSNKDLFKIAIEYNDWLRDTKK